MKKIGLILPTKPEDGGAHQYALLVMESLLKKNDFDLVVIAGSRFWKNWCKSNNIYNFNCTLPNCSEKEKVINYKFPIGAKWYNTYMTSVGKVIRAEKVEILFVVQQGIFIPNYNVKIVCPVHDLMHRYEPDFPEVSSSFHERELCMKSLAKYASAILVDSNLGKIQFRESYLKRGNKKLNIYKMPFVVPNHIWNAKEERIETPKKYIFYPAQFWKHKNHINLVKAIKLLQNTIPDIYLVLVGSEKNNGKKIKKYIKDNHLESNISILGYVSDENITYLYKNAVGMVMPSYFGPTNIPPLEAMALGCPVAVSNKYAMPEQVGKAGLLFDPDSPEEIAECIKKMWTDNELRKQMIRLGHKKVSKWTEKEFGEKLYKILSSL